MQLGLALTSFGRMFTITSEVISGQWDLILYLEILGHVSYQCGLMLSSYYLFNPLLGPEKYWLKFQQAVKFAAVIQFLAVFGIYLIRDPLIADDWLRRVTNKCLFLLPFQAIAILFTVGYIIMCHLKRRRMQARNEFGGPEQGQQPNAIHRTRDLVVMSTRFLHITLVGLFCGLYPGVTNIFVLLLSWLNMVLLTASLPILRKVRAAYYARAQVALQNRMLVGWQINEIHGWEEQPSVPVESK
jgi:hypothetical protein